MSHNKRNRGPVRGASAVGRLPGTPMHEGFEPGLRTASLVNNQYTPMRTEPSGGPFGEGYDTAKEYTQTTRNSPTVIDDATRAYGDVTDHDPETSGIDLTQRGRYRAPVHQTYTRKRHRSR